MSTPDPLASLSDDELVDLVAAVLREDDESAPAGAVAFATGALVWRDVDADLAELLHDSVLEESVVLRDDTSSARLLVFQARDITLDVEHGDDRLTGSISPPGRYRVAIQRGGEAGSRDVPAFLTDDAGMFEVLEEVRGPARFLVSDPGGQVTIVSTWIRL